MRRIPWIAVCLVGGGVGAACHARPNASAATAGAASGLGDDEAPKLPTVRVRPDGGPYVFSYATSDGKVHDESELAAIPKESRKQLLVRDLSRTPTELQSDRYLYLADLSGPAPDVGYPTAVVSRYQFDAQGDVAPTAEDVDYGDGGAAKEVIVYGTSWCGACKAARAHLKEKHIPFVEKDIEKEPAAAQELQRKARKAHLKLGGVPVIDVVGHLMMGYDPGTIDQAWAEARR